MSLPSDKYYPYRISPILSPLKSPDEIRATPGNPLVLLDISLAKSNGEALLDSFPVELASIIARASLALQRQGFEVKIFTLFRQEHDQKMQPENYLFTFGATYPSLRK